MTTTFRSYAHPAYRDAVTGEEERFYAELAKSAPLSETIKSIDFRFGEDSGGEPAVWFTIHVDDDLKPSEEKLAELNSVGERLRMAVLYSGFERWPYLRISAE